MMTEKNIEIIYLRESWILSKYKHFIMKVLKTSRWDNKIVIDFIYIDIVIVYFFYLNAIILYFK